MAEIEVMLKLTREEYNIVQLAVINHENVMQAKRDVGGLSVSEGMQLDEVIELRRKLV